MCDTNFPVQNIAKLVGFSSCSAFSRDFEIIRVVITKI